MFLGQVIFCYDLDSMSSPGSRHLLGYAETITVDVAFFAPQTEQSLTGLWPHLPGLLAAIDDADKGLSALSGAEIEIQRSRAHTVEDWASLRALVLRGKLARGARSASRVTRRSGRRRLSSSTPSASSGPRRARPRDGATCQAGRCFDGADDATAHDLFTAASASTACGTSAWRRPKTTTRPRPQAGGTVRSAVPSAA